MDNLEEASTSDPPNSAIHPSGAERRERSESDVSFQGVNVDLMSDMTQVLDQKLVEIVSLRNYFVFVYYLGFNKTDFSRIYLANA